MSRPDRARLQRDALALVQADGRLSLHEYLQAQVLHRQLSLRDEHPAIERRQLALADLAGPITNVTVRAGVSVAAVARRRWAQAALGRLGLAPAREWAIAATSELNLAIDRLALLGRIQRPALVKAWLEAAPAAGCPAVLAGCLRCVCLLIDTPLPPALAACFDPLPALPEPVGG